MEVATGRAYTTPQQRRPKRTLSQMASPTQVSQEDGFISLDEIVSSPILSPSPVVLMRPPTSSHTSTTGNAFIPDDGTGRRVRRTLDLRRPVISAAAADSGAPIIDLTSELSDDEAIPQVAAVASRRPSVSGRQAQRLPRFAREIIDLDGDEPAAEARHSRQPSSSPEIRIIETRQLPGRTNLRQPTPVLRRHDAQDVTFLETRRLPSPRPTTPYSTATRARRRQPTPHVAVAHGRHNHLARLERRLEEAQDNLAQARGNLAGLAGFPYFGQFMANAREQLGNIGFDMGIDLNFERVGFDMGIQRNDPPARPEYLPPPPVPDGFTRSPKEDEVLVCPNCGDELCEGESEQKRQIWVIKKCGHVYCGDCHSNRTASTRRKGKGSATDRKFSQCVVDGCMNKVAGKNAMIQLYL